MIIILFFIVSSNHYSKCLESIYRLELFMVSFLFQKFQKPIYGNKYLSRYFSIGIIYNNKYLNYKNVHFFVHFLFHSVSKVPDIFQNVQKIMKKLW